MFVLAINLLYPYTKAFEITITSKISLENNSEAIWKTVYLYSLLWVGDAGTGGLCTPPQYRPILLSPLFVVETLALEEATLDRDEVLAPKSPVVTRFVEVEGVAVLSLMIKRLEISDTLTQELGSYFKLINELNGA